MIGLLRRVNFSTLKSLALCICNKRVNIRDLRADMFPNLVSFEFDDTCCTSNLRPDFNGFLEGVRTLKKLTIVGCCFQTFRCKSDTLEELILWEFYFDEKKLRVVARSFPKLRRLTLHGAMYGQLRSEADCRKNLPHVPDVRFYTSGNDNIDFWNNVLRK